MSGPTPPVSPAAAPPSVGDGFNAVQAGVAAQVGIIAYWLIDLALAHLSVEVPDNVHGAFEYLGATAVAVVVAYFGSRLRTNQWLAQGQITGVKKLFALPLALVIASSMGAVVIGCGTPQGPSSGPPSGAGLPIPPNASAQQAYQVAWLAWTAAKAGAEIYCASPQGKATKACQEAAALLPIAQGAIDAVAPALQACVPADVVYAGTRDTLEQAIPKLEAAASPASPTAPAAP